MTVEQFGDHVRVTMTYDQLGILRYAIAEGVEKLSSTALFFKSFGDSPETAVSAKDTADRAKAASEELERAVMQFCSRRIG